MLHNWNFHRLLSYALFALTILAPSAYSHGSGGHGHQSGTGMYFDTDNIITLSGVINRQFDDWEVWGRGNQTSNGMHYLFDSKAGETYYVMLAPWWYLEENRIELSDRLKVKLTGSVVDSHWQGYDDYRYIIVTEITANGVMIRLHDEFGYPLWHGRGRHCFSPTYEDSQADTVSGTVHRVRTRTHGKDLDPGYEVIINAEISRYRLFVAPQWHVEDIGFSLTKGEQIKVRCSIITGGKKLRDLVARDIVADGKRWRFRNSKGTPIWIKGAK